MQGCGKGVQSRRVEAEAAGKVRWDGARGVDLAERLDVLGLYFTMHLARVVPRRKVSITVGSVTRL